MAVIAASALTMTLGAAACGTSDSGRNAAPDGEEEVNIGFIGLANSNSYTQWVYDGMKKQAEKDGANVTLIDGKFDSKTQIAAMQDAIQSKKFNAIFLFPTDASLANVVKQAAAADIPVAVGDILGTPEQTQKLQTVADGVIATIAAPSGPQQEAFVTLIKQACDERVGAGKPCRVATMPGLLDFPIGVIKDRYVKKELAATPNITAVETPPGQFLTPEAYKAAQTFLQKDKNIDVFFAANDDMAIGAMRALREVDLEPGKDVTVIGFGGQKAAIKEIKDGTMYGTVALYPTVIGAKGVETLVAAVRGGEFEKLVDPALIDGNHLIVTKKTLDEDPSYTGDYSSDLPPSS